MARLSRCGQELSGLRKNTSPTYFTLLYSSREVVDKALGKLSLEDHKSLRVVCPKLGEIINPLVVRRAHISQARAERPILALDSQTSCPRERDRMVRAGRG